MLITHNYELFYVVSIDFLIFFSNDLKMHISEVYINWNRVFLWLSSNLATLQLAHVTILCQKDSSKAIRSARSSKCFLFVVYKSDGMFYSFDSTPPLLTIVAGLIGIYNNIFMLYAK